jgi:5'-methylthioadenosine phosphorylase
LEKIRFAVVGGTGLEGLFKDSKQRIVKTPYGTVTSLSEGNVSAKTVVMLARHGRDHSVPPHRINYRANMYGLHQLGVEGVLATNAVGGIASELEPGDVVVPNDFIDFTKLRPATFYDEAPVTHIDVSEPYCPQLRELLIEKAKGKGLRVWDHGVLACTEGPRYETPAEIEMFRRLGCDIVGMTGLPEAVLARELEMCYATICYVSNRAAGSQGRLTTTGVSEVSRTMLPRIEMVLTDVLESLAYKRVGNCACSSALKNARFR